jgi:prepilin-type N-terminal cleavage/methylation domain-containing protein
MRGRRSGFTIIELLMTLTVVGLLSAIAVPKFRDVRRRSMAAQVLGDFDVLRHAAMSFYADSGYFPDESDEGEVPASMKRYLPEQFAMRKDLWTLDYENWELKTPTTSLKTSVVIGVSVTTPDSLLGRAAMKLLGNTPSYTVGTKYTFLVSAF